MKPSKVYENRRNTDGTLNVRHGYVDKDGAVDGFVVLDLSDGELYNEWLAWFESADDEATAQEVE